MTATFTDADWLRVEALTAGCQFIARGELHTISRVQRGPVTTYLVTDDRDGGPRDVKCSDGSTVCVQSWRTFAFATDAWVKGYA